MSKFEKDSNKHITNDMLAKLKSGIPPMLMPYQDTDFLEFTSLHTGKPYKATNRVQLWQAKHDNQLQSNGFLTFKQATEIAEITPEQIKDVRDKNKPSVTLKSINHPLADQKAVGFVVTQTPIYLDKQGKKWGRKDPNGRYRKEPTFTEIKSEGIKKEWITTPHKVWSVDQMSHIPDKWLKSRSDTGIENNQVVISGTQNERLRDLVQNLVKKNDIRVLTGEMPDYDAKRDVIVMPKINNFVSDSSFYRSLLHQIVHWTGHEDRLERGFDKVFGDKTSIEKIAQEELVAELGTAFMCQRTGLDTFTSGNLEYHASMMNPWVGLLEKNDKAIVFAASKAEKSVDFLVKSLEKEPKVEIEKTLGL